MASPALPSRILSSAAGLTLRRVAGPELMVTRFIVSRRAAPCRAGPSSSSSASRWISTILPSAIVKSKTTFGRPPEAHTSPATPSISAGCAAFARPENVSATAAAPRTSAARRSAPRLRRRAAPRPGRAPPAAPRSRRRARPRRRPSTTSRCRARSASGAGRRRPAPAGGHGWRVGGWPRASVPRWRDLVEGHAEDVVQHERHPLGRRQRLQHHQQRQPDRVRQQRLVLRVGPASARRRLDRPSRTLRVQRLLAPRPAERSMSRQTRATTVVSQPPRFSTSLVSARLSRSQASCTASSASLAEPSIR